MTYDAQRIARVARAISKSKGRNPDAKTSVNFDPEAAERLGFPEKRPHEDGVWLCDLQEAATFVAAFDAAQATSQKS